MVLLRDGHAVGEVIVLAYAPRTDLAMERAASLSPALAGVEMENRRLREAELTRVHVHAGTAAKALGKAPGVYWTLSHPRLPSLTPEERMPFADSAASELRRMLPDKGTVLVIGLGNRRITADALGARTVEGTLVTRPWSEEVSARCVCAMTPGVLGVTGLETLEVVRGMVSQVHPAAIIAVDSLAAQSTERIATTVQLTDTGICPGSGVGNHRSGLTRQTCGVPVIAVGVPMVVYAATIVRDALSRSLPQDASPEAVEQAAADLARGAPDDLVVTPRNIDELIAGTGDFLALAINAALHPDLTLDELANRLH